MKMLESIIGIKRWVAIIVMVVICFLQVPQGLATVDWYYWSPLTVAENITDLGGGSYRYNYSFVNVDMSPIWNFGINTTFITQGSTGGDEVYWTRQLDCPRLVASK